MGPIRCAALAAIAVAIRSPAQEPPSPVEVDLVVADDAPGHVHPPGVPFTIRLAMVARQPRRTPLRLTARWIDADGGILAEQPLAARSAATGSPATESEIELRAPLRDVGYCGLQIVAADAGVSFPPQPAGSPSRVYGFCVLPPPVALDLPCLGIVHANPRDPYLRGVGSKTLTWKTLESAAAPRRLAALAAAGLHELPVVARDGWDTDDRRPVPAAFLAGLRRRFAAAAAAAPDLSTWQIGIEENAGQLAPYYLANLTRKLQAIRPVAAARGLRLVYDTRGFDYREFERIARSPAMALIDAFGTNPYRWDRFEMPETWLAAHIGRLRELLDAAGRRSLPIWFPEFGVPLRGRTDALDHGVAGVAPGYAATYLVKALLIAMHCGVERVYLYNYQDRGDDPLDPEDHFGLRDYTADRHRELGHPQPAYAAVVTMAQRLGGLRLVAARAADPAWVFEFAGGARRVVVAWSHPDASRRVPWSTLGRGIDARASIDRCSDTYGAASSLPESGELTLRAAPTYFECGAHTRR